MFCYIFYLFMYLLFFLERSDDGIKLREGEIKTLRSTIKIITSKAFYISGFFSWLLLLLVFLSTISMATHSFIVVIANEEDANLIVCHRHSMPSKFFRFFLIHLMWGWCLVTLVNHITTSDTVQSHSSWQVLNTYTPKTTQEKKNVST